MRIAIPGIQPIDEVSPVDPDFVATPAVMNTSLVIIIYRLLNEIIWLSTEKEGVELTGDILAGNFMEN